VRRNIFGFSHMESLPLKRECAQKEYIRMCWLWERWK